MWEENKHPRDKGGQFTSKGKEGNKTPDWDSEDDIWDAYEKGDISEKEREQYNAERQKKLVGKRYRSKDIGGNWKVIKEFEDGFKLLKDDDGQEWKVSPQYFERSFEERNNTPRQFKEDIDEDTWEKFKELDKDYLEEVYDKVRGDENRMLDELRKEDWGISDGDLEAVVSSFILSKSKR